MATAIPSADAPFPPSGPFEQGQEPFIGAEGHAHPRHHNEPPLEERVCMDFLEDLEKPGELGQASIRARIDELLASAERAPAKIEDQEIAGERRSAEEIVGGLGDLCKQAREVSARLEAAREKHNRPILNAQRALKSKADGLIAPLDDAIGKIRRMLDDFARAETARRIEAERKAAEEARRAREALERENIDSRIIESVELPAPPPPAPLGRGGYGARVGTQKIWCHEIESIRQLPDRLLKHPQVKEVLDKLIAREIKAASGKIEIKGVRIWQDTKAAVR